MKVPIPDDVAAFVRSNVKSIWALELLLFLKRHAERSWTADEIVRELRASQLLAIDITAALRSAGVIVEEGLGQFRYRPANGSLAAVLDRLEELAIQRPIAVRDAIVAIPRDSIRDFSDAFRMKRDKE